MIVDMFNTVFWKSFGLFMKNKNFELIFFFLNGVSSGF